jgi:hypothetical protein
MDGWMDGWLMTLVNAFGWGLQSNAKSILFVEKVRLKHHIFLLNSGSIYE